MAKNDTILITFFLYHMDLVIDNSSAKKLAISLSLLAIYHMVDTNRDIIISFLKDIFVASTQVGNIDLVRKLDRFVLKYCWTRNMSFNNLEPGNGYHMYYHGIVDGPVVFHRQSSNRLDVLYRIYAIKKSSLEWIKNSIRDNDGYSLYKMDSISPFDHNIIELAINNNHIMRPQQKIIVDELLSNYNSDPKKSSMSLISGEPGVGKSYVARFLHLEFEKHNIRSFLLEGFNPAHPGLSIYKHVFQEVRHQGPFILLLDEIDKAMDTSFETNDSDNTTISHAKSKTDFCNFLDMLRDIPYLIVICTTNVPIDNLKRNFPEYLRNGRIDRHWTFKNDLYIC